MKRLKQILIVLFIILLIVMGAWLFARRKATQAGKTAPTFREFLSLGTSQKPSSTGNTPGTTSDGFTQGGQPASQTPKGVQTVTSSFTTNGFTPITTGGAVQDSNNDEWTGFGNDTTTGSGGSSGSGGTGATAVLQCSDEDTTILFTPEEIARLNVLKNRFYAVAETLHTDTDVAAETANYDAFKSKSVKITELYNYCVNSPVFTNAQATTVATQPYGTVVPGNNGAINYRVPTPFWHDTTKDNQAFVHQGSNWQGIFTDTDNIFPERSIEHALRLNLW